MERRQIEVNSAFKVMGIFDVEVALHPDVRQTVRVVIARSEAEAKKVVEKKKVSAKKAKAEAKAEEKTAEAVAEKAEEAKAE